MDYRTARHILSISYDDPASDPEPDVALHPLFIRTIPIKTDNGNCGSIAKRKAIRRCHAV